MENLYTRLHFEPVTPEQSAILVALLAEQECEGFEEGEGSLTAYARPGTEVSALLSAISELVPVPCSLSEVAEQNWNAVWESGFQPVIVDGVAVIRASFHAPVGNLPYELVITPRMSFGTGHHATTWLMVKKMAALDFGGKEVFDFGTGTGVLAILAEKMGAGRIEAVDNDPWSIANATDNLAENQCARIQLRLAGDAKTDQPFDIILANINRNVILDNMNVLSSGLKPGGYLLLSGLLTEDAPVIREAAASEGLVFREIEERNGWICLGFSHE